MKPVLYHHWRSSSSFRVRWALLLKKVDYESVHVNLAKDEHASESHRRRSPFGFVPVLHVGDADLTESVAIIEYLDEVYPAPSLLPGGALQRARIRQLSEVVNAGTQPLQNLSVLRYVSEDAEQQKAWSRHFIARGLDAYEALLGQIGQEGPFSVGPTVTMADLFLLPQCYNARRFDLDMSTWPRIQAIETQCLATPEARAASPENQAH